MAHQDHFRRESGSTLAGIFRLLGFFLLILILIPAHVIFEYVRPQNKFRISAFFHKSLMRLLNFRVRTKGTMATTAPLLFVANHSSYLDIPVLGTMLPAAFIAKSELASWPLFGTLAKLQHTLFVERKAMRAKDQKNDIAERLEKGDSLVLFPEGTSSDGLTVLPFRSGLFSAVMGTVRRPITLQPISITCTELDGFPLSRAYRPYYAWYGDMTLVDHLWNVFKRGGFTIEVIFHAPVTPSSFPDRKALAHYCESVIAVGVRQSLAGRDSALNTPPPYDKVAKLGAKNLKVEP